MRWTGRALAAGEHGDDQYLAGIAQRARKTTRFARADCGRNHEAPHLPPSITQSKDRGPKKFNLLLAPHVCNIYIYNR